jgi:diguanylate cyclase (GGDEF)-like protein
MTSERRSPPVRPDLAEAVRDGIVIFDANGRIRFVNASATTITSWSSPADLARLLTLTPGLVELRSGKWIELRFSDVAFEEGPCRAAVFTDVTAQVELGEAHRKLRDIGLVDPVTWLVTAPVLEDHLRRSLALAARDERWVGVLWLDLKRFKRTTTDGPQVANEVLRQTARRVVALIRPSDLAARVDDDAFAVVLTAMRAPGDAEIVAVRLVLAMAPPVLVMGRERSVQVHVGAATASDRAVDAGELLMRARDAAAETAKGHLAVGGVRET